MLLLLSHLKLQKLWSKKKKYGHYVWLVCLGKVEKALHLYKNLFWERKHIYITLNGVYSYNCFIYY